MGISVFGIGISGMNAAQAGLVTTGHNIANASTPGFSRQEVVQATNPAQYTGAGFIGQGVAVSTVKRLYSDALSNQLTLAQSSGSQLDAYYAQIQQLNNMLGDSSAGLSPALQEFFGAAADLAARPQSIPSRQALLSSGNALAARLQSLDQQIAQMRTGVNAGITASIASINSYAQQIASLNYNIVVAESASGSQPANDLRDQRDALIAALNQEVRATVVKEDSGSYDVFVGNGQPVVVGSKSNNLIALPSLEDPQRIEAGCQKGTSAVLLPQHSLQGGTLGGLMSFRSASLDPVQNGLGRVAMGIAQTFNDQHALGQDLNGALGTDFFSVAGPAVLTASNNAGTGAVTAAVQDVAALTSSDYQLQYNGASGGNDNFTLTRLSDGSATHYAFSSAIGYPYSFNADGIDVSVSAGARGPAPNDSWMLEPTRQGAGSIAVKLADPAAIAAAAPVSTASALTNVGNAVISAGSIASVASLPLAGPVTLTYDAATSQFSVAGAVPAVAAIAYVPGSDIDVNGVEFSISGTPANGDVFTLSRNANGISDNRNALALANLQTSKSLGATAGGAPTLGFESAYAELVSQVGNTTRQLEVTSKAQANVIAQTKQAQQSVSGVNLDEEAAKLLRYQQAYQASGKMIQIASTLFQTVLDLGR